MQMGTKWNIKPEAFGTRAGPAWQVFSSALLRWFLAVLSPFQFLKSSGTPKLQVWEWTEAGAKIPGVWLRFHSCKFKPAVFSGFPSYLHNVTPDLFSIFNRAESFTFCLSFKRLDDSHSAQPSGALPYDWGIFIAAELTSSMIFLIIFFPFPPCLRESTHLMMARK